jgi:hypothetical protein
MEWILLQPMVCCHTDRFTQSDWVRFAKRTVGFPHPHLLPFMIVSERVSESLACLQIVVNIKMHYVVERAEHALGRRRAETRVTAATTAALRQNHSRRQSAPGRSTVN